MKTRHTVEMETVRQLKAHKAKHGKLLIRARYIKQMEAFGYTFEQAAAMYQDVWDIAQLEKAAA